MNILKTTLVEWLRGRRPEEPPADWNVTLRRNDGGVLEARIDFRVWKQSEQMVRHMKARFGARVLHRQQFFTGDIRWDLLVEGQKIIIYQQDWGESLWFYAEDAGGESLVRKIADSVERELKLSSP